MYFVPEVFLVGMGAISNRCAYLHESYRTLRDGSLGWRCSRHFVPGYDQVSAYGVSLGNPPNRISPEGLTKYGTNRLRTFEPDRMRISSPFREKPLFRLTRGKPYLAGVKLKDVWTLQEPEKRAVLPSSSKRHPSPTPAGSHNPLNRLMLTAESSLRIDPANR
jgi:hypothetical protein